MSTIPDALDMRTHYVYRIYDANDVLLYIGCTRDVPSRIYLHTAYSSRVETSWEIRRRMARYTSESYATKALARAAERAAIYAEQPELNKQHKRSPVPIP